MVNKERLMEALLKKRSDEVSITAIAARLGVSENHLYKLNRPDERHLGVPLLQAIVREYPDLYQLVVEYATGGADRQAEEKKGRQS